MNKTIFLFGLAGVGKSYLAEYISNKYGYFYYEADRDLTPEMKAAIGSNQSFTDEMRDNYYKIVADRILELQEKYSKIIIAQSVYKNKHRHYLMQRIPGLKMVWIKADLAIIIKRLRSRDNQISEDYAKKISVNFEEPDFNAVEAEHLINDVEPKIFNSILN